MIKFHKSNNFLLQVSEQLVITDSKNIKTRILIVLAVLIAFAFGWLSIRWQFGNMLADLTPSNAPNAKSISDLAFRLSPSDPSTNLFAANVEANAFSPEKMEKSLLFSENAVRLAPYNFEWWLFLGRNYEQSEQYEKAEKVILHALELAPTYTLPNWQLGNFYLRRGRDTEAFAQLKKAAENNLLYREQVFSIAWDYYDKNTAKVEELAGNSAEAKASLTKFYAAKERPEDAVRIWETLSADEKEKHTETAKLIAQALYDKRYFRSSVKFISELKIEPNAKAETIENPGFESVLRGGEEKVFFGWNVDLKEKVKVDRDSNQKHEGAFGLRVIFTGFANVELYNLSQLAALTPSSRYRLSFWVKTENLKSAGTPTLEVVNAKDNKIISVSKAFPNDTNDWQQIQVDFALPADAEGAIFRLARSYCGENCLITGTIWLDDFKLEKLK